MATYQKFQQFTEDLGEGAHTFSSDTHKVAMTLTAPSVSADAVLTDLPSAIATTNLDNVTLTLTSSGQTAGEFAVLWQDLVMTATGTVPDFRYVSVYNDTQTSPVKPLICFYDYGSTLSMATGETLTVDWTTESFTVGA